MIWYLPLPRLADRYTTMMREWVEQDLLAVVGRAYRVLEPDAAERRVVRGEFLDVRDSQAWTLAQLALLNDAIASGQVAATDVVLCGDIWMPGLESARLAADLCGLHGLRFVGWHYAGVFDPADYYARSTGRWSRAWERVVCEDLAAALCVGSTTHRERLRAAMPTCAPVYAYGLSWRPDDVRAYGRGSAKDQTVIFPHRPAPEKGLERFVRCARALRDSGWRFVACHPRMPEVEGVEVVRPSSKAEYYHLLASASIFYSAAEQETFGYCLHEAIALGCSVVAPQRVCYPEMLHDDPRFLYGDDDPDGLALLQRRMLTPTPVPYAWTAQWEDGTRRFLRKVLA